MIKVLILFVAILIIVVMTVLIITRYAIAPGNDTYSALPTDQQ